MSNKCTINIIKIQKKSTIKIIYCTLRIVSIIRIIYYLFLRDMHSWAKQISPFNYFTLNYTCLAGLKPENQQK